MERNESYLRAKKRVENLKSFYIHLTIYILVNLMLFLINIFTDSGDLWFLYPLGFWGIGLAIHSLTIFSSGKSASKWEKRKIKEYMDRDK